MKPTLLAIVGSQRKNGNCYMLTKAVFDSVDAKTAIIQLADKEIKFCNVCGECIDKDCVLSDDFNEILKQMKTASGIVFAVPKYLSAPSKFLAFLERLAAIVHTRKHGGYAGPVKNADYTLFSDSKPFCLFALSGTGEFGDEALHTVADYIGYLGSKLIPHDQPPFIAVRLKAGDEKGEVLKNKAAIKQCRELVQKVITSVRK